MKKNHKYPLIGVRAEGRSTLSDDGYGDGDLGKNGGDGCSPTSSFLDEAYTILFGSPEDARTDYEEAQYVGMWFLRELPR